MSTARRVPRRRKAPPARRRRPALKGLSFTPDGSDSYARLSTRPLHVLVFLLPLIALYEVGSAVFLSGDEGATRMIRAERLLAGFFQWFGAGGLYLPGLAMIVVLLIWHVLTRDRWRIKPSVLAWMGVESVVWTVPLLVLGQIVYRLFGTGSLGMAAPGAEAVLPLSRGALATISVGAGLYEELLFRMVGIALVHVLMADLLGMRDTAAKVVAVVASALAFAAYHDIAGPSGFDLGAAAIYFFAGLYFGAVYVLRGFGIVVAVHAFYDLAVLVLLPGPQP